MRERCGSNYGTERGIFSTPVPKRTISGHSGWLATPRLTPPPDICGGPVFRTAPHTYPRQHPRRSQKFTLFEIAPSTIRFEPVVNEEVGLARNTAALAISCGVAIRPSGLRASVS